MLEMIKLSKKGMSRAEIDARGLPFGLTVSQVVNAREKLLKEIKSASPVNTRMINRTALLLIWRNFFRSG